MSDMGSGKAFHQSPAPGQLIVAFDFDGTLTIRDSFTSFLKWRAGPVRWLTGLVQMIPAVFAYLGDRDRGRIKVASVREFLMDADRKALEAEAERFAAEIWPRFMRPDALATWEDWGRRGAHRVIVTASPETTVAPFARRLGAENLIGTRLAFDDQDRVLGTFVGGNCRGEEKMHRLRAAYGADMQLAAAYGDTSGDAQMIAAAEEKGYRVFTGRP
ncbi:HAD-IB family hydrolase [Brevundimonas sp. 3P9-tot-E]|uniref:HAD-IB family hydrolase n=1 Tax=Brevundimonas TaxID=41275 RepID=UPI0034D565EF